MPLRFSLGWFVFLACVALGEEGSTTLEKVGPQLERSKTASLVHKLLYFGFLRQNKEYKKGSSFVETELKDVKFDKDDDSANLLVQLAYCDAQFGQSNNVAAFKQLNKLLELYPNHPRVLLELGWFALKRGETREGMDYLKKALKLDPWLVPARYYLARHAVGIGELDEGRRQCALLLLTAEPDSEFVKKAADLIAEIEKKESDNASGVKKDK